MQSPEDAAKAGRTAAITAAFQVAADADRHAASMRESLDTEMRDVKDGVLRMGSYVEEQILAALEAIVCRDAELARKVIASDGRVNEVQRAVSALVGMTIATQAPVARDLRYLLALDRVTYELERIGDHAGGVAKQARKLAGVTSMVTYDELTPMAKLAAQQVRDVVLALVDIDEAKAREVAARDDEIDRLYHQVFDDVLVEMRTDPSKVDPGGSEPLEPSWDERRAAGSPAAPSLSPGAATAANGRERPRTVNCPKTPG